jgi:nucleotide-binding universal stress UspA family protein
MEALQTSTRIALTNVLLTTDFGDVSGTALSYAAAVAQDFGGTVFVAHVVSPEPYLPVPLDPLPIEADRVWQIAQVKLAEFLHAHALGDTPHKEIMKRGELWTVLSEIIQNNQIDLLVTGTHGRQGLKRLLLGSQAERIYRQAKCPVLSVGPRVAALSRAQWTPKRILFPTDGSEVSLHALPYALSLAEQYEATLTLLQMLPLIPWQYQKSEADVAEKALRALVPVDAEAWCKPEYVVEFEFPAEGILRVARERNAELIVMGVRKSAMAAVSAHLPWPIASEVVSQASCPVLTVRG